MRKITAGFILAAIVFFSAAARADFKSQQLKSSRVRTAYAHKEAAVKNLFRERGVAYPPDEIFFRAFKTENGAMPGVVELWARAGGMKQFRLIKTYAICSASGYLGPKRSEGDGQAPEGFYRVAAFNPYSRFHLSLRLDYPNAADRILGRGNKLGGDIFMHGNCVTIGCIPMTDDVIEELYVVAVDAKNKSNRAISYYIFPLRMDAAGMRRLETAAAGDAALLRFWRNLQEGYLLLEKTHVPPKVTVNKNGSYRFRE